MGSHPRKGVWACWGGALGTLGLSFLRVGWGIRIPAQRFGQPGERVACPARGLSAHVFLLELLARTTDPVWSSYHKMGGCFLWAIPFPPLASVSSVSPAWELVSKDSVATPLRPPQGLQPHPAGSSLISLFVSRARCGKTCKTAFTGSLLESHICIHGSLPAWGWAGRCLVGSASPVWTLSPARGAWHQLGCHSARVGVAPPQELKM